MKKMKYIQIFMFLLVIVVFSSCDQDESVPQPPRENSTTAIIKESTISLVEGDSTSVTVSMNKTIKEYNDWGEAYYPISGQMGVRVVGGTATEGEDFEIGSFAIFDPDGDYEVGFSPYLIQDGYYLEFDATTDLEILIENIIYTNEDDVTEGPETVVLQFYPVGLGQILIDDTVTITITD